jgi:hypothetical protein
MVNPLLSLDDAIALVLMQVQAILLICIPAQE